MNYVVTVRGPVPPALAQRIAEAHAVALKYAKRKPTSAVNVPAGKKVKPSTETIRRAS